MHKGDRWIRYILTLSAGISILVVFLIFVFLGKEAYPFIFDPGLGVLWHTRWVPVSFVEQLYGVIPLITGSLLVTFIATLFMIPFGVLGALYIAELATETERNILKPFVEILAGIPSVVIGFFGLLVLNPIIKNLFHLDSGLTAFSAALLLALMAIPTVISISEDVIHSVPASYREASLALGAGRLYTIWHVILPASLPGIFASIMLGIGRVIGETMVVLMVTGNAAKITFNPFESVRTMTATIAAEMGEVAFGSTHYHALFWVGILLMIFTLFLNLLVQQVLKRYSLRDR